jgi:hypothetical protein
VTTADLAPDYAEPFEAWRVWRVVRHGGDLTLASVVKRTLWPAGEPLGAECLKALPFLDWVRRRRPHAAPELHCECGIYAGNLEIVRGYLTDTLPDARARVIGRVALWGSVVECERGYRGSYGYPTSLFVPLRTRSRGRTGAAEIAAGLERYGVPVEVMPVSRLDTRALLRTLR